MKAIATRSPFHDPFDELSDEEFEDEFLDALDQSTIKISLRVPKKLLERTKQAANNRGIPYQSLMKALIDQGVARLEKSPYGQNRLK